MSRAIYAAAGDELWLQMEAGDLEAAHELVVRGDLPTPAFQTLLAEAWSKDHNEVWNAAGRSRNRLRTWFRNASFATSYLPDPITVWRGGVCWCRSAEHWQVPASLAEGLSWTTDRDMACWFALGFRASVTALGHPARYPNAFPCVLKATISRKHVLAEIVTRSEREIVISLDKRMLRSAANLVEVDETGESVIALDSIDYLRTGGGWRPSAKIIAEWQVRADATEAANRARNAAHLEACSKED